MKKIKKFLNLIGRYINEEKGLVLFFLFGLLVILVPLPYYVVAPGGITDISDRIEIENTAVEKKTFHTTFLKEFKGRIPILVYSLFNTDYEIISAKDMIVPGEDYEDDLKRGKLYFEEAFDNALISSFDLAGFEYNVLSSDLYILYVSPNVSGKLKVGDKIISVSGKIIKDIDDITAALEKYNIDEEFEMEIIRDEKNQKITSKVKEVDGEKRIGIVLSKDSQIESTPKVFLDSKKNEYGPSGGFMTALSIYFTITNQKLDLKIAGTGTISEDSLVGDIGGVDKKVISASRENLDIFFVPKGENYEEAKKTVKDNHLKINLIPVGTLKEAVDYINSFKKLK